MDKILSTKNALLHYSKLAIFQASICDRFWENPPKRGECFCSVSPVKAARVNFFQKSFMMVTNKQLNVLSYGELTSSSERWNLNNEAMNTYILD